MNRLFNKIFNYNFSRTSELVFAPIDQKTLSAHLVLQSFKVTRRVKLCTCTRDFVFRSVTHFIWNRCQFNRRFDKLGTIDTFTALNNLLKYVIRWICICLQEDVDKTELTEILIRLSRAKWQSGFVPFDFRWQFPCLTNLHQALLYDKKGFRTRYNNLF